MAQPIRPSTADLERRRLESTIDQDLHSLSLASLLTTTSNSNSHAHSHSHSQSFISTASSSLSSVEYPRAFGEGNTNRSPTLVHPFHGPHGTPRAVSRASVISMAESPVSTAGHHVSAVTLADGVFRRGVGDDSESGSEWDPERSLGRLVGELGRVMSDVSWKRSLYFGRMLILTCFVFSVNSGYHPDRLHHSLQCPLPDPHALHLHSIL
jgi:hypothetical protein